MVGVLGDEDAASFVEEIVLLVYIRRKLQAPGPGTFSASG